MATIALFLLMAKLAQVGPLLTHSGKTFTMFGPTWDTINPTAMESAVAMK